MALSIQVDMRKRFRGNQAAIMVGTKHMILFRPMLTLPCLQGKELQEKRKGGDGGGL